MKLYIRFLLILATTISSATLLFQGYSAAALPPVSSLTTSPVLKVLNASPGASVTTQLYVINNSSAPETLDIKLFTFGAYGTTGKPALRKPTPSDTYLNWAQFSPSTIVAQPHVLNTVTMTINVPPSAALGYNYAVLFQQQSNNAAKNATTFQGSNAILVLLNVLSGNEKPSLQVSSIIADKHVYEYLPVNLSVNIHNNGNIFLPPQGTIFISKNSNFLPGTILATLPINSTGGNVLPGTNRVFNATWTNGFPVFKPKEVDGHIVTKKDKVVYKLDWNFSQANEFRFGRYYAKIIVSYQTKNGEIPVTGVVSFWVIPWKLLGILCILLILMGYGLYAIVRPQAQRSMKRLHKRR
jgi:hypothetical protein